MLRAGFMDGFQLGIGVCFIVYRGGITLDRVFAALEKLFQPANMVLVSMG